MRIKPVVLVVLAIVPALPVATMLWPDQAIEPAALRALEPTARMPADDNLFNHITGLAVAEASDPATEAYAAVTRVNALLADSPALEQAPRSARIDAQWVEHALTVDDRADVLCSPKTAQCITRMSASRAAIRELARNHAVLIARYQRLADTTTHRTELLPHVAMPVPRYSALLATHRLLLGNWLADALEGDRDASGRALENLRFVRRFLAQADLLLAKMVAANMLAETVHVYAAMMDAGEVPADSAVELAPLSEPERSMDLTFDSEFRFNAAAMRGIAHDSAMFESKGIPRWLGAVGLRALYKPNRSINQAYRCFTQMAAVMRLPGDEFRRALTQQAQSPTCRSGRIDWVLNPVGTILLEVAQPSFGRYAARLHDLDGLITWVNLKRATRLNNTQPADIDAFIQGQGKRFTDPYQGAAMQWDASTGSLFFSTADAGSGYDTLPLDIALENPSLHQGTVAK